MADQLTLRLRDAVHLQCGRKGANFTKVERLLAQGADPGAAVSARCESILAEVCNLKSQAIYAPENRAFLLDLFVRHGANPVRYPNYMYHMMFSSSLGQPARVMLSQVDQQIESGNQLSSYYRDHTDRNLLAIMTQDSNGWHALTRILDAKVSILRLPCMLAWRHELDGQGRNLAHLAVNHAVRCMGLSPGFWPLVLKFIEVGVDLRLPDHVGVSACQALVEVVNRHPHSLPQASEHLQLLQACLAEGERQILARAAPPVRIASSPRRV